MIIEMKEQALFLLENSWPTIFIAVIIAVTLRLGYLYQKKERFILHEELFKLLFIVYTLCLFQAVTYQDVTWSTANFIPFKEIFRYDLGSGLFYKNVFGNMLMFLPYGIFASKYLSIEKTRTIIIFSLVTSLSIEVTQLIIGRVFDVDDIILNVLGALFGYLLYRLYEKFSSYIPKVFKKDWILNLIEILLLGGAVWFLIP